MSIKKDESNSNVKYEEVNVEDDEDEFEWYQDVLYERILNRELKQLKDNYEDKIIDITCKLQDARDNGELDEDFYITP